MPSTASHTRVLGYRKGVGALILGAGLLLSCGDESSVIDQGPPPSSMCRPGEYPVLAAFDAENGDLAWVTCDTERSMYVATAASATDVWVEVPYPPSMIRIDARTGEIVARGEAANFPGDVPDDADWRRTAPPGTPAVQVRGGQDDPLVGIDTDTGGTVWSAVGFPAYDDVWAGDDQAVYLRSWDPTGAEPGSWIVAYLIETGEPRWRIDAPADLGEPWHVADGRLYSMWSDLWVLDTDDGSVLWNTTYGEPSGGFPRMFGAVANDDLVFVSFTSIASGGD
jgi:outer membrane protein assembly factor BamB